MRRLRKPNAVHLYLNHDYNKNIKQCLKGLLSLILRLIYSQGSSQTMLFIKYFSIGIKQLLPFVWTSKL